MSIFKLIIFITWKYLLKIKYISYSILYRQNNNLSSNLKIQNTLKKNGYVVIKNFLSRSNCKKIINDIDTYFSKNNTYWVDKEKSDKRIFGSENISKLILDFHKNKKLKAIGSNYVGVALENAFTMANRVKYHKKNKGSGGGWHKDSFTIQYKTILYLNDVNINNGPFELIMNSQRNTNLFKNINNFNLFQTRFSNKEINNFFSEKNKIKSLGGSAGTLIIVDSSMIHRGRPLYKGCRYALTNYYYPYYNYEKYKTKFKPMLNLSALYKK
jgi:ectoine hydroxylase-related dioxygenase (phytanoyl-CoA dioxygenase family)